MKTVGLLPASGKASRVGGIPKFVLPISEDQSLLEWHIRQMLEVCDEVRVCTRPEWMPLIQNLELPVNLSAKNPSSMTDAIEFLVDDERNNYLIGMPDTYIHLGPSNIYRGMLSGTSDIVLGTFECPVELFGKVGQLEVIENRVKTAVDKKLDCTFSRMWGLLYFRNSAINLLDSAFDSPSKQIQDWIDSGHEVSSVEITGQYIDAGTFRGISTLYESIKK